MRQALTSREIARFFLFYPQNALLLKGSSERVNGSHRDIWKVSMLLCSKRANLHKPTITAIITAPFCSATSRSAQPDWS